MININFLANRVKQKSKQKEQDIRIFRLSSYILGGVCLLMVGVFAFKLFNNLKISANENKIKEYHASILAQESVELNYLIFVNKIRVIGEIYQKRSNKQEAMSYFADTFADKAEITGMSYQEEQGGLILQLSSNNVFQFKEVNEILDSDELRQQYHDIEKNTLARADNGSYKLTLKLELKTNARE
jgi:hypothetical protein